MDKTKPFLITKAFISVFILIFILSIVTYEVILHLQRGSPPLESRYSQFEQEYYIEIYNRFFKKVCTPDGNIFYETQRSNATAQKFSAYKNKNTRRIFIIGGSVAMGAFSDSAYFENLLKYLIPTAKFEVICCGMGAYDSYRDSLIEKEIFNYSPDLIIVMSGNNEYFTPVRINPLLYKLNRLFRKLWVYRELQEKLAKNNIYKISRIDRLVNFENNLRTMVNTAKREKVPIVFCTLPVNFHDCPPKGMPPWQNKLFFSAWINLKEDKNLEEARRKFELFLMEYPENAFGHYFLAQCYEGMSDYPHARDHYLRALNFDVPGDRSSPQRNEIIRHICNQRKEILADLEKAFIKISTNGLTGSDLFVDYCHWWGRYNSLVYKEIIQAITEYNGADSSPITPFLYKMHNLKFLGEPDFLKAKIAVPEEEAFSKILFSIKSIEDFKFSFGSLYPIKSTLNSNFLSERAVSSIEVAYYLNPNLFISEKSILKKQISEKVYAKWPGLAISSDFEEYWPIFLYHTGETFRRLRLYTMAIEYFSEAIKLNPNLWFPYLGRSLAYYALGFKNDAQKDIEEADKKSVHHALVNLYRDHYGI